MVGGSTPLIFQTVLFGRWISDENGKKISALMHQPSPKDLNVMTELFETGKVVPIIDRRYPLSEVPQALRYLGEGQTKGKVVITVAHNNESA